MEKYLIKSGKIGRLEGIDKVLKVYGPGATVHLTPEQAALHGSSVEPYFTPRSAPVGSLDATPAAVSTAAVSTEVPARAIPAHAAKGAKKPKK